MVLPVESVELDDRPLDCMFNGRLDVAGRRPLLHSGLVMARWPRHAWTTLFTYGAIFVLFPALCWLAYAWVRGWLF